MSYTVDPIENSDVNVPYVKFRMGDTRGTKYNNVKLYGKGYVGGKTIGLIFLKYIIERQGLQISEKYQHLIRIPKSFIFKTSFYDEFMELNNMKDLVYEKCIDNITPEELRNNFLKADLPTSLEEAIASLLLESRPLPLIVRSSSLLEDNLQYSFAGIYHSEFISNMGSMKDRMAEMVHAIKIVYASVFSDTAKQYRLKKGIQWTEEKMALLVQEIVGREHRNHLYYPIMSGVIFTKNYYPWSEKIKPEHGLVRLVYGLGTKAVGRSYARVFSPSRPDIRPEGFFPEEIVRYSQKEFDVIDLNKRQFITVPVNKAIKYDSNLRIVASTYTDRYISDIFGYPNENENIILTFDRVMKNNNVIPLIPILKDVVINSERIAGMPMDLEFAVEIGKEGKSLCEPGFYIVQNRPLGVRREHRKIVIPDINRGITLLESHNVMGNGKIKNIRYIVYVSPSIFAYKDAHEIAREVGRVNRALDGKNYVLIGPGRWATTHPDLGVPVEYGEISNAAMIIEIATDKITPELSYGTHFFGDLVSTNILYSPIYPKQGDYINKEFLESADNIMDTRQVKVVKVKNMVVYADGQSNRTKIVILD